MRVVQVQFAPWDPVYYFDPVDLPLSLGNIVIATTEIGTEAGRVFGFAEIDQQKITELGSIKPLDRLATAEDLRLIKELNVERDSALSFCRKVIKRHGLEMKLVDANFSFDGSKITFAFIADGRVDFREVVKELTRHWHKNIRLQQLGVRDEARLTGDFGSCGRQLCCRGNLRELCSITSDMIDCQQIAHRGSDRLTGCCGRLRCCLAYEKNVYEDFQHRLPPIGSKIKTEKGLGEVIRHHVIKGTVEARINDEVIIEVPVFNPKN